MSQELDRSGTVVDGKYVLERLIGRGGMGTVYAARQLQLDRQVAVKIVRPELMMDERAVARFNREARAAARIEHPNAVRVYDFGQSPEAGTFIVMEFVEGVPLRTLMRRSRYVPIDVAVEVIWQAASAIAVAHGTGIVHRDLKPENLMVRVSDEGSISVKVVDFGLAKLVEGDVSQITSPAELIGTPRYMAPEQFEGERVDERVDVYALGVILYEMIAGRPPFDGTFVEVVGKHLYAEPPAFASIGVDAAPGVEAVVRAALAKRPDQRTPSVMALARDFVRCFGIDTPTGTALVVPSALTSRSGLLLDLAAADDAETIRPPEQYATRVSGRDDAQTLVRGSSTTEHVCPPPTALVGPPPTELLSGPVEPPRRPTLLYVAIAATAAAVLLTVGALGIVGTLAFWKTRGVSPPPPAPVVAPAPTVAPPPAPVATSPYVAPDDDDDGTAPSDALLGVPFYVDGRLVIYGDEHDYPAGTKVIIRDMKSGARESFVLERNDAKTKWIVKRTALSTPGEHTIEELVPSHTWVEISVRKPDGTETAPRMITRADE